MLSYGNGRFRREFHWRLAKAIAIAVTAILLSATAAFAYDRILLRAGDVGDDASFLQRFLDEELELFRPASENEDEDEEEREWAQKYIRDWVRFDWIFVGRFDINDDGQDELFVMLGFPSRCGSAGCDMKIFRRTEQGWQQLPGYVDAVLSPAEAHPSVPGRVDPSARGLTYEIWASEERVGGYRTLVGDEFGARWQPASEFKEMLLMDEAKYRGLPGAYLGLCFSPQCAHEQNKPLMKPPPR